MWAAIRSLGTPGPHTRTGIALDSLLFSPAEVIFITRLNPDTVTGYFRGLAKAEPPYIQIVDHAVSSDRRRSELWQYRLLRDVGVEAPAVNPDGSPTEAGKGAKLTWDWARAAKEFDCAELAQGAGVPIATVKSYVRFLCRAGYLAVSRPNRGPYAQARYRFVRARNTGPRAPLIVEHSAVMDGNNGQIVWEPREEKGEKGCRNKT
jgi:hypothetical protein